MHASLLSPKTESTYFMPQDWQYFEIGGFSFLVGDARASLPDPGGGNHPAWGFRPPGPSKGMLNELALAARQAGMHLQRGTYQTAGLTCHFGRNVCLAMHGAGIKIFLGLISMLALS